MSWTSARPQDTWGQGEMWTFLREIYTRNKFASFVWDPPNVPATSTVDTTLTTADSEEFLGLRAGQSVTVTPPATFDSGLMVASVWVGTDDTLTIRLANVTGGDIDPATDTWAFHGVMI
jgi:hypothetical protein